ncbi:MAG: nucleotidyltransferase domain-containing protein [Vulcanimicrobiaceae bacterium]
MGALKRYEVRVAEQRERLAASLERFVALARSKPDVRAVYVFGSFATGAVGPTSDLDVLVVRATELPPHDRGDDLYAEAKVDVGLDLVVVTPQEHRERLPATSFGRVILATARQVYAA